MRLVPISALDSRVCCGEPTRAPVLDVGSLLGWSRARAGAVTTTPAVRFGTSVDWVPCGALMKTMAAHSARHGGDQETSWRRRQGRSVRRRRRGGTIGKGR
ncbi:hypothetical protein PAHAL_5G099900 [Panicum hallii]|uniref:Uncharacterized protein n=1 Tax=Panicum hallii TaxID=206008 RepID=A0A2T8IJJ0_9POAL|nr:hypothetical protein PAHAL_5G099900 [Panicum hallii]